MKNLFKFIIGLLILTCAVFLPLNASYAAKWNRACILFYIPKDGTYDLMFKKAVSEWQSKTKKMAFVTSQLERDLNWVDIDASFNKLTSEDAKNSCAVGLTLTASNHFKHVKITVNVNESPEILEDPEKKQENMNEIYALMLKSVGMALGVPASTDENSVMYKEYKEGQKLLPSDIENLYKNYGWPLPNSNSKKK